ncbi:MAG: PTS sugar transporter subunit IIA [Clostridiales bacterium]|jgi:PTS system ascorbate-specific IIA component|nr:PTS sugar transporter subunit IIA [Clostridiales bacterium]
MLRELVEKKRTLFIDKANSWEDAIHQSCKTLLYSGVIGENYADEIIRCINEYGPYIVIMPGIAIPHSQENATGGTGIGFMKVGQRVIFDECDPDKYANLFFTLATTDPEAHLKNMRTLSNILTNEALIEDLHKARSDDDLLLIAKKYNL